MNVSNSDVNLIIKKNDILLKEKRELAFNLCSTRLLLLLSLAANVYLLTKPKK